MMSTFDKDDYLKDLPDAEDAAQGGRSSEPADTGSSHHDASSASGKPEVRSDGRHEDASDGGEADEGVDQNDDTQQKSPADAKAKDDGQIPDEDATSEDNGSDDVKSQDTLTPLGQAKKEAAEYLEALQRERAEFVNFRNRSNKEQQRFREHGIIDVLSALLPALDDIDRIRAHSDMDESFNAVATKIDKAFAKFGVEKFGEVGETFDPVKHEAVLHKPDPKATKETVDTVVEAGYRIGDRVIRAARVVVASPKN